MPRVAPALSLAALALFGSFLAGCGGSSSSANGCGTHQYSYVGGGLTVVGGAPWYGGDYGGGWYDPGDDGSDYSDESASANGGGGSSGDDGSGTYGDGSGDDGNGDDGSYNDGSGGDGSGSSDDGSGDDGSGDDGSGDDGTASKKHLHTSNVSLHTQSGTSHVNACYAYSCDLLCAVGSPATAEREAHGYSAISANDACVTAAHGVETWAHDSLGSDVSACKLVTGDQPGPSAAANASRTPAAPAVSGGFSSSTGGTTRSAPYTRSTIR
jgi:hypothetical protein